MTPNTEQDDFVLRIATYNAFDGGLGGWEKNTRSTRGLSAARWESQMEFLAGLSSRMYWPSKTPKRELSDHRPVVADFALPR